MRPPPDFPVFRTLTLACSRKCRNSNRCIFAGQKGLLRCLCQHLPTSSKEQQGAPHDDLAPEPHPQCACKSKGGFAGGSMQVWRDIQFDISCQNGPLRLPDTRMAPRQSTFFFLLQVHIHDKTPLSGILPHHENPEHLYGFGNVTRAPHRH